MLDATAPAGELGDVSAWLVVAVELRVLAAVLRGRGIGTSPTGVLLRSFSEDTLMSAALEFWFKLRSSGPNIGGSVSDGFGNGIVGFNGGRDKPFVPVLKPDSSAFVAGLNDIAPGTWGKNVVPEAPGVVAHAWSKGACCFDRPAAVVAPVDDVVGVPTRGKVGADGEARGSGKGSAALAEAAALKLLRSTRADRLVVGVNLSCGLVPSAPGVCSCK